MFFFLLKSEKDSFFLLLPENLFLSGRISMAFGFGLDLLSKFFLVIFLRIGPENRLKTGCPTKGFRRILVPES